MEPSETESNTYKDILSGCHCHDMKYLDFPMHSNSQTLLESLKLDEASRKVSSKKYIYNIETVHTALHRPCV